MQLDPEVHAYLVAHGTPPDDVQQALIDETTGLGDVARMQIAPEQGAFLTMLVRLMGAGRAVEWARSPATRPSPSPGVFLLKGASSAVT